MGFVPYQKCIFSILVMITMGVVVSTLTGCSGPDSNTGLANTGTSGAPTVVVDIEQTIQRIEPSVLDELARSNPFNPIIAIEDPAKNQLMASTPSLPNDTASVTPMLTTNALDDIKLSGIIYSPHSRHSMAILQVGTDGTTQILQQGQSYTPSDGSELRIQVDQITKESVRLTAFDKSGQVLTTKPCYVKALIGFKGKKASTSTKADASTSASTSAVSVAVGPTSSPTAPAAAVHVTTAAPSVSAN